MYPENVTKREIFEKNLEREGLQLESEEIQNMNFVKIHAPNEVLRAYCDLLKIKLPIKEVNYEECFYNKFMRSLSYATLKVVHHQITFNFLFWYGKQNNAFIFTAAHVFVSSNC